MACAGMEGLFFPLLGRPQGTAADRENTGILRKLSFLSDNRFIAGITLHLPAFTGYWPTRPMRLSKIKLAGFKSFVDPTTITFPSSLVGVVGPNGCGKSNVI
ncbi:MAG: AAA family ATPase, partial [Gammaproteobacteria bacterium]|nr:AAA family ATPase [Gammaproteobacteria bacterium]